MQHTVCMMLISVNYVTQREHSEFFDTFVFQYLLAKYISFSLLYIRSQIVQFQTTVRENNIVTLALHRARKYYCKLESSTGQKLAISVQNIMQVFVSWLCDQQFWVQRNFSNVQLTSKSRFNKYNSKYLQISQNILKVFFIKVGLVSSFYDVGMLIKIL